MNKLSFKVYLLNEELNKRTEVRRFCLDVGIAKNFVALREKLQSIFPELHEKNFIVTWKDDEDTIVISTSEELEIALDEMGKNESVKKLYVTLQSEKGEMPYLRNDKTLHAGVVCDVCDNSIRGIRFKCMQCTDYDLCTSCMTMGYHPEHFMVRMTEPVVWSSYYGRRLAHHMRKFMKKTSNLTHDKDKGDETRKCPYKSSGGGGGSGGGGNKRGGSCPGSNVTGGETCHEQKRFKEQQRDPSTEAATEATEDLQQANSLTQLLKMFEKNLSHISQFLDPLGINVIVTSDNDNTPSKPATNSTPNTETNAPSQSDMKFPGEGKKLRDDIPVTVANAAAAVQVATTEAVKAAQLATTEAMKAAQLATTKVEKRYPAMTNDVSSSSSSSSSSPLPQASQKVGFHEQLVDEAEWTVVGHESPEVTRTTSASSCANGAIPKQSMPIAPSAPASKPETEPAENIYPPLPPQEFYHPDPKIQRAVDAMMSMGFTNQGGWLTHLLVSKDGDISKALDVLQPVRR